MSLTGNKVGEACARRPNGRSGGVKSPSGEWSSSSPLLVFPKIMLSTSRHGRVREGLWQTLGLVCRKLRRDVKGPPVVWLNPKMISTSFPSGTNGSFPLPWDGEHHPEFSICNTIHSFLHPTFIPIFFSLHCKSEAFSQTKKIS